MKPAAAHSLLLRSLCLALCCLGGARASWRSSGNHEWKKLIMVHHWPVTVCKDLLPKMKMYWPDVIHPLNHSHFWKHEWEKHGTCAAQVDTLNSEKKYFGRSLDLYQQLELNSMLQKLGIKPSINYYQISDIKDALASIYGVIPKVQCLPPKQGEEVQTIGQIELCFTKELQLRNCTEPGEPREPRGAWGPGLEVCEDGPAFYPPPQRTAH
ncbi:ribonuclease T2 isoform X3 [Ailuropoda melanoleuca]|uniref:ribonuclease T2 isoform X3 n=1 Tax=Ailuropoda melanoleuca TaxID=9646 RepID=UPI001494038F|nr:ribonuclease T2 isoform X3 [Ailuropoda melanoleuca]